MSARSEQDVIKSELKWAVVAIGTVGVIFVAILGAALAFQINPPSNIEMIDSKTLHLSGEFTEANLGTALDQQNRVVTRIIATQFAFQPRCVVVPRNTPVTLRFATPDVIHGILVGGTNVNTMVVPGYVAQVHTVFTRTGDLLMPCDEFCGMGHSQMWATVRVVDPKDFHPDPLGRVSCEKS